MFLAQRFGNLGKTERPQIVITKKRKSGNQGDKTQPAKKRKEGGVREPSLTFADFGGNTKVLEVFKIWQKLKN